MSSIDVTESATTEKPLEIRSISREDACKISSGQVISSLAIAVKELVENSLDAGATLIEVKFKDMGLQGVEVCDNGYGVKEEDFQGLTTRHATSKLKTFNQLEEVQTFGFRGEALNSLCALGDIVIVTKNQTANHATRLEFDHAGKIHKKSPNAGSIGTSVHLTNLFAVLPVRKREFQKNIKKEYGKAIEILTAYCLVSGAVRIVCTNQTKQGVRNQVMQTNANSNTVENIRMLFGKNQMDQLVEIKPPKFGTDDDKCLEKYEIEGWVSDCHHGNGRSSKDRQFFYINSRPCESPSIMKFINEVYRRYNPRQYPFIFLNIKMDKNDVDINVTPDKRQLYFADERVLKLSIETCLSTVYERTQQLFEVKTAKKFFNKTQQKSQEIAHSKPQEDASDSTEDEAYEVAVGNPKKYSQMVLQWKATGNTTEAFSPEKRQKRQLDEDEIRMRTKKMRKIQVALESQTSTNTNVNKESNDTFGYTSDLSDVEEINSNINTPELDQKETESFTYTTELTSNATLTPIDRKEKTSFKVTIISPKKKPENKMQSIYEEDHGDKEVVVSKIDCGVPNLGTKRKLQTIPKEKYQLPAPKKTPLSSVSKKNTRPPISSTLHMAKKTIRVTFDQIKSLVPIEKVSRRNSSNAKNHVTQKFKSKINPSTNDNAEAELRREVSKDMFLKMEIVGQFNLGFIIVRLADDLFIIDQHASAEKFNFEDLTKNTVIQTQQMVCSQQLEMTATSEMVLIDNLQIFERNGFRFKINNDAPVTKRVSLIAKPFSRNWDFGKEDIEEMVHMLYEAPNVQNIRPSRVRAMFASRACRKSVMIGDPLTMGQMRKIVDGMSRLDQPWNCPHGRPTMRHLVNLKTIKDSLELQEG